MNTTNLQDVKLRYKVVGNCDALNRALDVALKVAPIDLSVLIIGESGVGKEIIPRIIHDNSPRKREKYFAINCGSIPEGTIDSELFGHEKGAYTGAVGESEGYFGVANKGTIFLDEVGELPLSTQARLLRVLETGEYIRVGGQKIMKTDVRIVAATNVNMRKAISEGRFREDLFYRLNAVPIQMPPLRDRGTDILLLFKHFAMQMQEKYKLPRISLDADAEKKMLKYKWPGNIRQLKNVTEQMSVLAKERMITAEALSQFIPEDPETTQLVPVGSGATGSNAQSSYENERELLYKILYELRGNVSQLKQEVADLKAQMQSGAPIAQQFTQFEESSMPAIIPNKPASVTANGTSVTTTGTSVTATAVKVGKNMERGQMESTIQDAIAEEISETESLNLDDIHRIALEKALERNGGNRKKAARELGISDRTLYRKMHQYGIDKKKD